MVVMMWASSDKDGSRAPKHPCRVRLQMYANIQPLGSSSPWPTAPRKPALDNCDKSLLPGVPSFMNIQQQVGRSYSHLLGVSSRMKAEQQEMAGVLSNFGRRVFEATHNHHLPKRQSTPASSQLPRVPSSLVARNLQRAMLKVNKDVKHGRW